MKVRMAKLCVFVCVCFFAVATAGRRRCPSKCTCYWSRNEGLKVACIDKAMKRFPRNLPESTTELNLSGNLVSELNAQMFRGLKEVKKLRISRNVISYVDKDAFNGLLKLEEIDLRGNVITALAAETFRNLNKLKSINLAYNKISNLDSISQSFVHLPSLESLTLTGNQLRTLPANAFQKLRKLQELYLSHNPLRSVSADALSGRRGQQRVLNKLFMSYTHLKEFPTSALIGIRLGQLDISHGQIQRIDSQALEIVRRMDNRDLKWEGNPLKCDCNSQLLREYVNNQGDNHSPITCAAPEEVAGMDIYYVQKRHLVCGKGKAKGRWSNGTLSNNLLCLAMNDYPRFVRQPVSTSIHAGGAVVLVCQADGNPNPGISWLKNGLPLATHHCGLKHYKTCTGSLVIHDVDSSDVGEYVCVIKDGLHRLNTIYSKPATITIVQPCNGTVIHSHKEIKVDDDEPRGDTSGSGDQDDEDDYETTPESLSRVFSSSICPDPGTPVNGHRYVLEKDGQETGPFPVDTVIRYGCGPYYEIEGEPSLRCRSNKTWSHPLPQCKPACGRKDVTDTQYLTRDRRAIPSSTGPSDTGMIETGPRIIHGEVSLKGEWPWLGLLTILFQSCGVSLLNRNWAVTAAHCVVEGRDQVKSKSLMRVYFGRHQSTQQELGQQGRGVRRILVHPKYGITNTFDYDVALLELEAPVDINKGVRPVCLPPRSSPSIGDYDKVGMRAVVTGWGKTSNSASAGVARRLHKGVVEIASNADCSLVMGNVTSRMVCAGKYSDTCQGDSGGPLVIVHQNRWFLSGITSWGPKVCGNSKYYGVYTRVTNSDILNWIHVNINSPVSQ